MDKILVIDDELGPRESLRILLKNDYEIHCAESVEEGVDLLRRLNPDLVIMDIRMPKKDGIQGLAEIREIDPLVSVIMLTGFGALETAQKALRLGANDYLKKPFDTVEIMEVIKRNIDRTHRERRKSKTSDELKNLNVRLVEELAEKERMASLGQASAEFMHDLRNPLTIIVGYVQLLADKMTHQDDMPGSDDETGEYLEVIEQNVRRCYEMAQMWQGYAKGERGALKPTPVGDLIKDVARSVEPLAAAARIKLEYDVITEEDLVMADAAQLLRAVHNILSNAIHAVPNANGTIHISCREEGHFIRIQVEDNGVGMSDEELTKAFEPYYTTKEPGKGTGLGLPITKKIVEEHSGELDVTSEQGVGTTVTILLPLMNSKVSNPAG